jgi:2-dehydropantoate 2-reductase
MVIGSMARVRRQAKMKICIVGAGAIGGLTAAFFARAGHEVSLVARGEHLRALQREGLRLISADAEERFLLPASDEPAELGAQDAVFLCLKTYAVARMLPRLRPLLRPHTHTPVVPALNGLPWWYFHREGGRFDGAPIETLDPAGQMLAALHPAHIVGCVVHAAAEVMAPGVVRHVAGRHFILGEPDGTRSPRIESLSAAMRAAGFDAPISQEIRLDIWTKLIGNLSYNPVAALTLATMGEINANERLLDVIRAMMREAVDVARAYGVGVKVGLEERIDIARRLGNPKISMHQDIEKRRPLETPAIVGSVMELASKASIDTPMIRAIHALIEERGRHLER